MINELLASTTSSDPEFIELYNTGTTSVDLTGWSLEFWDSDDGPSFGGADGSSPYSIGSGTIAPGGFFTLGTELSQTVFGYTADQILPSNSIENSSFTAILLDNSSTVIESIFVTDGDLGDAANQMGTLITPDFTIGPDGTFLPAGFYRVGDGSTTFAFLEFSPQASPSATPGAANPDSARFQSQHPQLS